VQDKIDSYLLCYKRFAIHKRKLGKAFHAIWTGSLVSHRVGLNTPLQRSICIRLPDIEIWSLILFEFSRIAAIPPYLTTEMTTTKAAATAESTTTTTTTTTAAAATTKQQQQQ
jgi:hypothetical protein